MGSCNSELLFLLADGEASDSQAQQALLHTRECGKCSHILQDLKQIRALFSGISEITAPARIRARLNEAAQSACPQIKPLLGEYIDTELDPVRREALSLHFAFCQSCRQEMLAQSSLRRLVSDLPHVSAPASIRRKAREALAQEGARRFQWLPVFAGKARGLGYAAALACAVLAFVWLLPSYEPAGTIKPQPDTRLEIAREDPAITEGETSEHVADGNIPAEHGTETVVGISSPGGTAEPALIANKPTVVVRASSPRSAPTPTVNHAPARVVDGVLCSTGETAPAKPAETVAAVSAELSLEDEAVAHVNMERNLPIEIAQARTEMLRASERHRVLKTESLLSLLPLAVEPLERSPEPNSSPVPDVSAPNLDSWA